MSSVSNTRVPLRFAVNGTPVTISVPPDRVLLDVLREELGLTGTKEGCSVGVCGLCSILVDGVLMTACILPAVKVDERSVTTIEGIGGADGTLSLLQDAFIRHGGFQCGICTPGQLVAATALLAEIDAPTEAQVRDWMTGNLCRCTGYYGIVEAILAAAAGMRVIPGDHGTLEMRPPVEERVVERAATDQHA